jgi:hypothetical protein
MAEVQEGIFVVGDPLCDEMPGGDVFALCRLLTVSRLQWTVSEALRY